MLFNTSDDTLVERALGGSQRSWEKLVARHELQVSNHCLRMTGNRADAMDLMQEVFLSIFRNLPSFRGQARFSTWTLPHRNATTPITSTTTATTTAKSAANWRSCRQSSAWWWS